MTVRSRILLQPYTVPTTTAIAYTVPADRTAVVRSMWIVNRHATAAIALRVGIASTAAANRIMQTVAIAAGATLVIDSWWALDPLTDLYFSLSPATANTLNVTLFGALLDGAPD